MDRDKNPPATPYEYLDIPTGTLLRHHVPRRLKALILNFGKSFTRSYDRSLKGSCSGPAVLLGNGPGLQHVIESARYRHPDLFAEAKVIALNSYLSHQEQVGLEPDFYVLGDPTSLLLELEEAFKDRAPYKAPVHERSYTEWVRECTDVVAELANRQIPTFVPKIYLDQAVSLGIKAIPFAETNLASSNITDITRAMGIPPISSYIAAVVAHYLGFYPIYHAGIAHDTWQSLRRDPETGLLEFDYRHFYEESANVVTMIGGASCAYYLEHFAQVYRIHEKLTRVIGLRNLNPTGLPL